MRASGRPRSGTGKRRGTTDSDPDDIWL